MLLAEKYAPQKTDDVLGNHELKRQLKRWALNWGRGEKGKPIILTGPTGVGKTTLVNALAKELNLELVQMSASDFRSRERVEKVISGAAMASTLSGKGKVILVDDIDAMAGREDYGGVAAIAAILRENNCPMILTATDAYEKKISSLRFLCDILKMRRSIAPSVAKLLTRIAEKEGIPCPPEKITEIAQNSNGDIRAAINDLQSCSPGLRDQEKSMFERLTSLFRASTYKDARESAFGDVEHDYLKLWIDENLPAVYSGKDLADAFSMLSRADIFDGRIRSRQHWGFLRYSGDLMTAGVSLAREDLKPRFARYSFPTFLRHMGATVASRATMKSLLSKIGRKVHTPSIHAESFLPIVAYIYAQDPERVSGFYGLEEKETEFLEKFLPKGVNVKKEKKKEKEETKVEKKHEEKKEEKTEGKKEEKKAEAPKKDAPPKKQPHARHSKLSEFF
ncbi:replication factor C large subunit [Candidatus Micrarchaeota archaeon]|nr:replication factor C large subunit [Candidatus Micrarchaeota archaeon]